MNECELRAALAVNPTDSGCWFALADACDDEKNAREARMIGHIVHACADLDDDAPRQAYAALCAVDDPERAEFIQHQLLLASATRLTCSGAARYGLFPRCSNASTACSSCFHRMILQPRVDELLRLRWEKWSCGRYAEFACENTFSNAQRFVAHRRGFIDALALSGDDWVRRGDQLAWRPKWRKACDTCLCHGVKTVWVDGARAKIVTKTCPTCRGTGYVPRRMPDLATHPIRGVTLTQLPTLIERIDTSSSTTVRLDLRLADLGHPWRYEHIEDPDDQFARRRAVLALLEAQWPGIKFWLTVAD